ncbi:MAG: repressor LexA [Kosmotogales bacterium]|nr:repressor LexA [Kosmotogales bacterium]
MSKYLTYRQKNVLEYIKKFIEENGFPPTIREISAEFNISSASAVTKHLKALEKKGFIIRKSVSRGIQIVEKKDVFQSTFDARFYYMEFKTLDQFELKPLDDTFYEDFLSMKENYIGIRLGRKNLNGLNNEKDDLLILKSFLKGDEFLAEDIFIRKNGVEFQFTDNPEQDEVILKSICILSTKGVIK